jgi:hypothetical protein
MTSREPTVIAKAEALLANPDDDIAAPRSFAQTARITNCRERPSDTRAQVS